MMNSKIKLILSILCFLVCNKVFAQDKSDHQPEHQFYQLGDYKLENGIFLPSAFILYVTHGKLNADGSNVILLQTAFGGTHHGYDFLIGPGLSLDSEKYFIVITELFGGSGSSSPSNTPPPFDGPRFPDISIRDNIRASYSLLTQYFNITHLKAVIGFSMGAQQAFQWAVSYPDFMDLIVPICGTAKTYHHGIVRLESVNNIIKADPGFNNGDFDSLTTSTKQAWASHWAAWLYSQEWWRLEMFKPRNKTPDDVIEGLANAYSDLKLKDQLFLARTWQNHNIGDTDGFGGDVEEALRSIKAHVLYTPGKTDLYFPIQDAKYESQFITNLTFVPIPSSWGHLAGVGASVADRDFLNEHIRYAIRGMTPLNKQLKSQ